MKLEKEFYERLKKEAQEAEEQRLKSIEHHQQQKFQKFLDTGNYY